MTKEERVIEIKEHIDAVYGADCAYYNVDGFAIANELDNAGYRKKSETAKDIFEKLSKIEEDIYAFLPYDTIQEYDKIKNSFIPEEDT